MNLPPPSPQYDAINEAQMRRALEAEDKRNLKMGKKIPISDSADNSAWYITVSSGSIVLSRT